MCRAWQAIPSVQAQAMHCSRQTQCVLVQASLPISMFAHGFCEGEWRMEKLKRVWENEWMGLGNHD